jgi:tetratricopeptide (TPR) repeat protein
MTEEKQNNDLEHLSRTWHEKIKQIRTMAKERQKNNIQHSDQKPESAGDAELPADNELFAGPVPGELTAQQVFAGNEDFYKSMESAQPTGTTQSFDAGQVATAQIGHKSFSSTQKALAAAIILIAAMLLYSILKSTPEPDKQIVSNAHQTPTGESVRITPQQARVTEPILDPTQPLSLKIARTFYIDGDYDQASDAYEKLHKALPAGPKEDLMRDFLQLQVALCMERTADYNQAGYRLTKVLKSKSPAVRAVAYYHCSLLEMQKKQYLNARTKAYQAVALIDTIDFDQNWSLSLKRDCYFLAAETITRKFLSLSDSDKDLPEDLWLNFGPADEPFYSLNETQLRTFLNSGSQRLNQAVIAPQIQSFEQQGGLTRYDVTCNGAPVEELMARFAANSDFDIHWDLDAGKKEIRKRPVYLHLLSATAQQFVTAAAGCSGLLAEIDEKNGINIFNPAEYSNVSEHLSFLGQEAVSLWQKFLLRFTADPHLANVHYALGLLHTSQGRPAEAIAEYKLVANRFYRSSLAPFALLNSGKIKNGLRDYDGACRDLENLVEEFSDTKIAGKANLYLADTTAKTGRETEAAHIYNKVYNLSLSLESQRAAALGAGNCFYRLGDYKETAKWLTRYINLAADSDSKDLYSAYFLLGKTALASGNSQAACKAFKYALQGGSNRLAKEQYIETISALAEAYMQQEDFVQALDILQNVHPVALSQKESAGILLLKSKTLRAMGLVDNAIAILGNRAEYIPDTQLKTQIYFELCDCYIQKGNLNLAHNKLTEILIMAKSGPLVHKSSLRLAKVCLQLGQHKQAISICSQLLDLQPAEQIKKNTLDLLAMAYNQQKNYDRAALALLGQWK